jgi:protocatechuate 3,4-dioxygenase beta subunit
VSRLGHRITRRQTLGLAGLAGAAYVTGCRASSDEQAVVADAQTPSCVLVPEVTEGPYFVDAKLRRTDIRANSSGGATRAGIPLALTIRIVEVGSSGRCSPYRGAAVDIWHCDAEGLYSAVDSDTDFLRGYQVTNANGAVTFTTIFPGWYRGRAIHIHLKVRTYDGATETYEYTSQLFFSETTIGQAYGVAPYSANGTPDVSNAEDGIYAETGGTSLVQMSGSPSAGYTGTVTLGLSDLPESDEAEARLLGSAWTRDRRGRRRLRAGLELGEPMRSVQARLVRDGRTLASSKVSGVPRGTRALSVSVGRGVEPGPALLVIVARDRGSTTRTIRRRVRIPQQPS